jgi:hypothetical protein
MQIELQITSQQGLEVLKPLHPGGIRAHDLHQYEFK